jgi:hypothetical protein
MPRNYALCAPWSLVICPAYGVVARFERLLLSTNTFVVGTTRCWTDPTPSVPCHVSGSMLPRWRLKSVFRGEVVEFSICLVTPRFNVCYLNVSQVRHHHCCVYYFHILHPSAHQSSAFHFTKTLENHFLIHTHHFKHHRNRSHESSFSPPLRS